MEEEMFQAEESLEETQITNFSSQSSVAGSEYEDEMTAEDIIGSFLHSVEICEQSNEEQEKLIDKILASQEPSEPDCLRQLQLFIERESYKVIDLTETDSNEEQWQNDADEIKIKMEAKEEPEQEFESFESPSASRSNIKREISEERNKRKNKRKYKEVYFGERKIKLFPRKFHLRPRARLYWNEENILYVKTQENIYSYWEMQKKSKTTIKRHKKESQSSSK